jgi:O-antigen ligase
MNNIETASLDAAPPQDRLMIAAFASLLTLIAAILFYPDAFADVGFLFGPFWVSPLEFVFAVTAPWIVIYSFRNLSSLRFSVLDAFFIAALLYFLTRGLISIDGLDELGRVLAYPVYAVLIYYGSSILGQRPMVIKTIFSALLVIGTVVIAYAFIEYFLNENILFSEITRTSVPIPPDRSHHRISSTLGHPVVLGLFIVQIAPFFIFKYARSVTLSRQILLGFLTVCCAFVLLITFTKGAVITAIIIAAISIPLLLIRYRSGRGRILVLLAAVIAAIAIFSYTASDDVSSGLYSEARIIESRNTRLYMWERVPGAVSNNLVFGAGIWQGVRSVSAVDYDARWTALPPAIDNVYMTFLVEQGIIGFLLIAGALLLIVIQAYQVLRDSKPYSYWMLPIVASMAAPLINGATFDSLMIRHNTVLFWMMAGMLRAYYELTRDDDRILDDIFSENRQD